MTAGGPQAGGRDTDVRQGAELLERAVGYALGAVGRVTPELLDRPTPCRGWDLGLLLRHLNESLAALLEGAETHRVRALPGRESDAEAADPAAVFRSRAAVLLGAWTAHGSAPGPPVLAGCPLGSGLVAAAGALEIAVHGWDVHRSCDGAPAALRGTAADGPALPAELAVALLGLTPVLVPASMRRGGLFAPPVPAPRSAGPASRLLAFLGRDPAAARDQPS